MNLLGSMYINTRDRVKPLLPTRKPGSQQDLLEQEALQEWKAGQGLDSKQLLADLLSYSKQNVPFYRQYFAENPGKDPSHLTDWPILTRDHLCNQVSQLQSTASNRWKTWTHASGGSTGRPVAVVHDEYFAAKAAALRKLCAQLFFDGPHYNQLILWGMVNEVKPAGAVALKTRLKDGVRARMGLRTQHINTFEFTQQKFETCVQILRQQKPTFIFGYAGSIYELAKYLDEKGIRPVRPPKMIGTTAQTLHPFMRERIEKVFGCRVCDHYGSREVGPAAWQHEDGPMCFPKFFSKIEVVGDDGEPAPPGEQGRILVTALHNLTMPLIRYDIGDLGIAGPDMTYKGFSFATLAEVTGRTSEEFTNPLGSKICAPFFINLFYYRPWLDQFYIVQKALDLIEIMYVPKHEGETVPGEEREAIDCKIRSVMTDACRVEWKKVSEIPTTKAGKRLFIRSEVQNVLRV